MKVKEGAVTENNGKHRQTRLLRAALISPLIVPLILGIGLALIILVSKDDIVTAFWVLLMTPIFGLPLTYFVTFVFILPLALFLRRINALRATMILTFCSLIGPPALYFYLSFLQGALLPMPNLIRIPLPMAYGLISGIAFCRIAKIPIRT